MMWTRGTVAAVLLASLAGAARADTMEVQRIEAFLVQGHSGTLSADIMPPKQTIGFWNTIIGEGGAGEGSEDVLVVVHYRRLKQSQEWQPVTFKATDEFDKPFFEREGYDIWFNEGNAAAKAFLLEKVTCRHIKLIASAGEQVVKSELPFQCGE